MIWYFCYDIFAVLCYINFAVSCNDFVCSVLQLWYFCSVLQKMMNIFSSVLLWYFCSDFQYWFWQCLALIKTFAVSCGDNIFSYMIFLLWYFCCIVLYQFCSVLQWFCLQCLAIMIFLQYLAEDDDLLTVCCNDNFWEPLIYCSIGLYQFCSVFWLWFTLQWLAMIFLHWLAILILAVLCIDENFCSVLWF